MTNTFYEITKPSNIIVVRYNGFKVRYMGYTLKQIKEIVASNLGKNTNEIKLIRL